MSENDKAKTAALAMLVFYLIVERILNKHSLKKSLIGSEKEKLAAELKRFEREENYEECARIRDMLNEKN